MCAYLRLFDIASIEGRSIDRADIEFVCSAIQRMSSRLRESHWSGDVLVVTDHPEVSKTLEHDGYLTIMTAKPQAIPAGTSPEVGELLLDAANAAVWSSAWDDSDVIVAIDPTMMLLGTPCLAVAHRLMSESKERWISLEPAQPTATMLQEHDFVDARALAGKTESLNDVASRAVAGYCRNPYGLYATSVGVLRRSSSPAHPNLSQSSSGNHPCEGILLRASRVETLRITSVREAAVLSRRVKEYQKHFAEGITDEESLTRQIHAAGVSARDIHLLIFDFDGVMTDNRVLVMQDGTEGATCNRSDGLGIGLLKEGIATNGWNLSMMVMSKEKNPVVGKRCEKLKLECRQGIDDKLSELHRVLQERGITLEQVAYVGNDINDLACMRVVGLPIAVGDAYPPILAVAKGVTTKLGGHGAVREVCDWFIASLRGR